MAFANNHWVRVFDLANPEDRRAFRKAVEDKDYTKQVMEDADKERGKADVFLYGGLDVFNRPRKIAYVRRHKVYWSCGPKDRQTFVEARPNVHVTAEGRMYCKAKELY